MNEDLSVMRESDREEKNTDENELPDFSYDKIRS